MDYHDFVETPSEHKRNSCLICGKTKEWHLSQLAPEVGWIEVWFGEKVFKFRTKEEALLSRFYIS